LLAELEIRMPAGKVSEAKLLAQELKPRRTIPRGGAVWFEMRPRQEAPRSATTGFFVFRGVERPGFAGLASGSTAAAAAKSKVTTVRKDFVDLAAAESSSRTRANSGPKRSFAMVSCCDETA